MVAKSLEASYLVGKTIAMAGEACTVTEILIKACILDAVNVVLSEISAKERVHVPMSHITVGRRIDF